MSDPLPCPFCGSTQTGFFINKDLKLVVQCLACHTQGPSNHDQHGMPADARDRALALWNARAKP